MSSTTQIVTASAATALALTLAYAVYFDHRRRHDPTFRRSLARERRRHAKSQRLAAAAESENQKTLLKQAVEHANEEGFPTDVEEREAYFMNEVALGEQLIATASSGGAGSGEKAIEAAMCFYRALRVYPDPKSLVQIYEKTVPKNILDILAEAISYGDSTILAEAVE